MAKEEVLIAIDAEAVEAARAEALPDAHLLLLVETFQALADPTRARILYALTMRPMCVRDLAIHEPTDLCLALRLSLPLCG